MIVLESINVHDKINKPDVCAIMSTILDIMEYQENTMDKDYKNEELQPLFYSTLRILMTLLSK